jgi:hypothetical protein
MFEFNFHFILQLFQRKYIFYKIFRAKLPRTTNTKTIDKCINDPLSGSLNKDKKVNENRINLKVTHTRVLVLALLEGHRSAKAAPESIARRIEFGCRRQ